METLGEMRFVGIRKEGGIKTRCTGHEVEGTEADKRVVALASARRLALAAMNLDVAADLLHDAGEPELAIRVRELLRQACDLRRARAGGKEA